MKAKPLESKYERLAFKQIILAAARKDVAKSPGLLLIILLITLLWSSSGGQAEAQAVGASDDQGRRVSLSGPAKRVISLSPSLTELVFAAGGGDRLVGVAAYSDYPPAAAQLPRVGDALALQMEKILSLRPDLILAWQRGNNPRQLERLADLGVPIYYSDIERLEDVASTLERLGDLLDTPARAAAADFRSRLARLGDGRASSDSPPATNLASTTGATSPPTGPGGSTTPDRTRAATASAPVRVLYQVWGQPLMTINGRHVITDLIERCGGVNVFAAEPVLVPQIGIEAAIAAAPEAIIASGSSRATRSDHSLDHWRRFGSIPAVARGFLFLVDGDSISRATPRMLDAGEAICGYLDQVRRAR